VVVFFARKLPHDLHFLFILKMSSFSYNLRRKGFFYVHQISAKSTEKKTDDCVIRALTKALGVDWDTASIYAIVQQIRDSDIYVKNYVWGNLLIRNGFTKHHLPDTCPDCYSIKDFCEGHKMGVYVLGTGDHVVTVVDGDYYDSFDSGDMIPIVYYRKEARNGL